MEKLTAQKGFEFFLIKLMYDKGVDSTFQDFKLFRSNFKSSVEASRCIGKIKSLLNNMKYTESSELIQELDKKILKKVEEYR
ncbi:MAG: hypothetical protein NTU73_05920 [Ignavibacteriae bacterium]|nr:hypothetical protein [Ignavibacteriota bacterium]